MPRVPDKYLNAIVYIYPSEEDANNGEKNGGCGFAVGVPALNSLKGHHLYIVTCRHVVKYGSFKKRVDEIANIVSNLCQKFSIYKTVLGNLIGLYPSVTWEKSILKDAIIAKLKDKKDIENLEEFLDAMDIKLRNEVPNSQIGYPLEIYKNLNRAFIRVNNKNGSFDIIPTKEDSWTYHENFDDIAVYPMAYNKQLEMEFIYSSDLLTQETINKHNIGIGDDVRIIGRYTLHDGKNQNLPSVRHGNISMMNIEEIEHHSGLKMEVFLVEMRSRNGYSGSPAFVYFHLQQINAGEGLSIKQTSGRTQSFECILGMDIGHLESYNPVKTKVKYSAELSNNFELPIKLNSESLIIKIQKKDLRKLIDNLELQVNVSSGMTMITPAWKILEILEYDELKQYRQQIEENVLKLREQILT